jgi:hypothetical protein
MGYQALYWKVIFVCSSGTCGVDSFFAYFSRLNIRWTFTYRRRADNLI